MKIEEINLNQKLENYKLNLTNYIKGDKSIWGIVLLLSIFSFLPVYSTASNLVYVIGSGSVLGYLFKHVAIVTVGFIIMYFAHLVPYRYFSAIAKIFFPVVTLLLIYTALQGSTVDGANSNRWITLPIIGFSFQTSTVASVILLVYVSSFFSKNKNKKIEFFESILKLWLPVFLFVGLILPANLSTSLMLMIVIITLSFFAGYPFKYLISIILLSIYSISNRIDTWFSWVETFYGDGDKNTNYQSERAKSAIAMGGIFGIGAGKSMMKNVLPQSSSDFIYAIIAEEYGIFGSMTILFLFIILMLRVLINVQRTQSFFGKLLIFSMGLSLILQAFVNMGVATGVLPVTGQPLPLISAGGTSIWMTFLSVGIILSVTANNQVDLIDKNEPIK